MEVLYRSTRGNEEGVSASKAILEGLASDGGLFVPQALPSFDKTLDEFAQMDYRQTAYEVMKLLLTDFTEEELRYCIDKAYDGKFDTEAIAPCRLFFLPALRHLLVEFFEGRAPFLCNRFDPFAARSIA